MTSMIIDGLVVAQPSRPLFEDMRRGGLTACNFTCGIWEGLDASIRNVAEWKSLIAENADLVTLIRSVDDILAADKANKTGIILGWQNSDGFGDFIPNVSLFHELGLRVVQLTYNSANSSGGGCYESQDGGLSDFGRELVLEMNKLGILVDLSHVGRKTTRDVIRVASKPPAYTHCCPSAFFTHARNKSDEDFRAIAEVGGFVGAAIAVPHFLPKGWDTTIDDAIDALMHIRNIVGADHIGIGTDLVQGRPPDFFDWISRDKGTGRAVTSIAKMPELEGFASASDYPNLVAGLERRLPVGDVEKVLSKNWLGYLREVWKS